MRNLIYTFRIVPLCGVIICAMGYTTANAKKPTKPSETPAYTIVPFAPPGVNSIASGVADLNEQTQAVGFSEDSSGAIQGIHLDYSTGVYTTLAGGTDVSAGGINDANQIVGSVGNLGALWQHPGADPDLLLPLEPSAPQTAVLSGATAINNDGMVLGASEERFLDGNGQILETVTTAVAWHVTTDIDGGTIVQGPVVLPPLSGHVTSFGGTGCLTDSVSGVAMATGYSSGPREAVTWTLSLRPDGTLDVGGPFSLSPPTSRGKGINQFADVCGRLNQRPFLAIGGQTPQLLSVPRNTQDGYAYDVNDLGSVVGQLDIRRVKPGWTYPAQWHAYVWHGNATVDLSTQIAANSGWSELTDASSINNVGVIAGTGWLDVQRRGFLMIPNSP